MGRVALQPDAPRGRKVNEIDYYFFSSKSALSAGIPALEDAGLVYVEARHQDAPGREAQEDIDEKEQGSGEVAGLNEPGAGGQAGSGVGHGMDRVAWVNRG